MTTVQQLTANLTTLLNESKRKNNYIKQACDAALTDMKVYQSNQPIDEVDTSIKSNILRPFLLACDTSNVKFVNLAIPVIHKLTISKIIQPNDLNDVLKSLMEATHLAIDIQLRILQCLPTLIQNYSDLITGKLLNTLLRICSSLTSNNKSAVVINTASATLQQLFSHVFDRISIDNKSGDNKVTIDKDETISLDNVAYEGFQIFSDLCSLAENSPPTYFKDLSNIKILSVLEIIEHVLLSHEQLFNNHKELSYLLRIKLVPSLLRSLNHASAEFSLVVRTMRVLLVLLSFHLNNLIIEGEIILSILNHFLLNDESSHWQKILVLEMFKGLFSNFNTIKTIYQLYDLNPKKKNVTQELLSILNTYLQYNSFLIRDIVQPPNPNLPYLSKQYSSLKLSILDHLDKSESPSNIPKTYPLHLIFNILILFTDGVSKFIKNLSTGNQEEQVESDIELVNNIMEVTYVDISQLFKLFMYSLLDNDNFHLLIRSLQKYIHTAGLLGLNSSRDGLLSILSIAIIRNDSDSYNEKIDNDSSSTLLQESGKNLLALGGSIVETLTSTEMNFNPTGNKNLIKSRNFNSRHVSCLRALINLAISLGSTLDDSWSIIWVTFQWCDYYINGLNEFSGTSKNEEVNLPKLGPSDLTNVQNSMNKFYESISEYSTESFRQMINPLIRLCDIGMNQKQGTNENEQTKLVNCPYNKVFFIDKVYEICNIDGIKFLVNDEENFKIINSFFINTTKNSLVHHNLKLYIIGKYTEIIKNLTIEGTKSSDEIINKISQLCLNGLDQFLNELITKDKSSELLTINNQIEIHLIILDTLNQLIENYDKTLTKTDSWIIIFNLINNPFSLNLDEQLKEKMNLLVNSSFNSLKLIVNEFMVNLPTSKFKILIDTLNNFCLQKYDLNISFSSISYYWLVSDTIKSRFSTSDDVYDIKSEEELTNYITKTDSINNDKYFKSLDIFLLLQLITLSSDDRAQVRDGSVQTFFEIIDIHGSLFHKEEWSLIYNIVFGKVFDIKTLEIKELKETVTLKLDGLITIYNNFNNKFLKDFWWRLIDYIESLIGLNSLEINLIVFKKFNELLKIQISNDQEINERFYQLWINVPIDYDFNNPELYVDCLTNYVILYKLLNEKFVMNENRAQEILNNFTKIIRYPILFNKSDDLKPSVLQVVIIENIRLIKGDDKINNILIRELSNLMVYQIKIRERIESKFKNSNLKLKYKLPTFKSIGRMSFDVLEEKFNDIQDLQILITDSTINKLLRSLIELIDNKSDLWERSNEFLVTIIDKVTNHELSQEIWQLILKLITTCFNDENNKTKQEEMINISQYFKIIDIVLPKFPDEIFKQFTQGLYDNCYLYEFNEIEQELDEGSIETNLNNFLNFDFDSSYGSTKPMKIFPFKNVRMICLKELIKFTNSKQYNQVSIKYFILRLAFTLRRLIEDEKLIYKSPVSSLQKNELNLLLLGLIYYMNEFYTDKDSELIKKLSNLLIRFNAYSHKYDCSNKVIKIMLTFNNRVETRNKKQELKHIHK